MSSFVGDSYRFSRDGARLRNSGIWNAVCLALFSGACVGIVPPAMAASMDGPSVAEAPEADVQEPSDQAYGGLDDAFVGSNSNWSFGGFVRGWASFNLRDVPETDEDDKFDMSMLRLAVQLEASYENGPWAAKIAARLNDEYETSYERRLQRRADLVAGGQAHSISESNDYQNAELREWYVDYSPNDRFWMRLGRQQIVWGETDFFQAMDIISGYDFRWRSFLEPDADQVRKALIIANFNFNFPDSQSSLQLWVRPGLDRREDIGNDYDLFGGRWAVQPYRGVDFGMLVDMDGGHFHKSGDYKDPTGGIRFKKQTGNGWEYTVSAMRTFYSDPVFSPSHNPYKGENAGNGLLADAIHPIVNVVGFTANRYFESVDGVFSTEQVFIQDAPYNYGTHYTTCLLLGNCGAENELNETGLTPGLKGITEKNTLISMFRFDKSLNLQDVLGTSLPSLWSVQVFNKHIFGYSRSDELVDFTMFGGAKERDTTIVTSFIGLNYKQGRLNPGLAAGYDVTHGGGFVIPYLELAYGDKWRLRVEADLFFPKDQKQPSGDGLGIPEYSTHLMGWSANANQLLLRLTRQF